MKKPKIEYYWALMPHQGYEQFVNWRLVGANGEIMCQSTQGFRDKADARRSVVAVANVLTNWGLEDGYCREVGPGRKPK